jgi:HYR domain
VDTTPPDLNLPNNITEEATGPSGASATFSVSASDLVAGSVPVNCDASSGDTFPIGTTTVHCSATDAHNNQATGSFTVTVQDTTAPTLNLPANKTVYAVNNQAVVTYSASASDIVDGSVPIDCSSASGSTFSIGTTTVNCSATDSHGNTANGSFTVSVVYPWSGFFQPVDNLPTENVVKAGSAIPVKFSLGGNQGLNILASGSPSSVVYTCGSSAGDDPIELTVTAGSSSLQYDATANQYIYVWKTDKNWGGTCRQLKVKLADGTVAHAANFKFTK